MEFAITLTFGEEYTMSEVKPVTFGLSKIGQIAVPVTDLERAVPFYRDQLGMNFLFQAPPGLAFFEVGGVRLLLDAAAEASEDKRSSIIYYQVEDIQSAYEMLQERGVTFEQAPQLIAKMPDHDLWMAFFRDPDGNLLALMCEKRH
jgi:methylmalonyl-CoA/ethylmalonyl-CoA epimerase